MAAHVPFQILNVHDQALVRLHTVLAAKLTKWFALSDFLCNELIDIKTTENEDQITDPDLKFCFESLFGTGDFSFYASPSGWYAHFSYSLRNLLADQLHNKGFNSVGLYNGPGPVDPQLRSLRDRNMKYNVDDWALVDGEPLTAEDIEIIGKFRTELLAFLSECLNHLRIFRGTAKDDCYTHCEEARRTLAISFAKLDDWMPEVVA